MRRIDEILARLLVDLESRVVRPNEEVVAAIMAHGWPRRAAVAPQRTRPLAEPVQFEMAL